MTVFRSIDMAPAQMRYALGYACVCAWAVILLLAPVFGTPDTIQAAPASMLPGLATCLASLFFVSRFPSITGRTGAVALSSLLMAAGTLLCTFPASSSIFALKLAGLVLSGMFAIVLIMAWFDVFARLKPRAVVILSGCSIIVAAALCWGVLACSANASSVAVSLLPMVSFVLLPTPEARKTSKHAERVPSDESLQPAERRSIMEIVAVALPIRTLIGLAITFFIVDSLGTLAPEYGTFSEVVSPASLLAALGVTVFFVASAFVVRRRIDPTILYKALMFVFAAIVLLITFSIGINASLVFCTAIVAEVMMWTVLALLAKKTPVMPHHVFAVGWIAECIGRILGQTTAPLFIGQPEAFSAVALMLILVAVGFAFSEGTLMLDVEFEDEREDSTMHRAIRDAEAQTENADNGGKKNREGKSSPLAPMHEAENSSPYATPEEMHERSQCADDSAMNTHARATTKKIRECSQGENDTAGTEKEGESDASRQATQAIESEPASDRSNASKNDTRQTDPLDAFVATYDISRRERDVLELWLAGRGLKYIENTLFISESTVKSHLRSIYRKCDTHNRDEIISLFERSGR